MKMLKGLLVVAAAVAVLAAPSALQAGSQKDIVDTAVAAGSFQTLATALKAAGLIDTLKGPGSRSRRFRSLPSSPRVPRPRTAAATAA